MMIALTPRIPICRTAQYFNPHFRKGSDRAAAIYRMPGKYFNPHFRKGSDWFSDSRSAAHHYFNPHFRKGSDGRMSISGQERMRISIHTSAREVTYSLKLIMRLLDISIHTSAREVTASSMRTYRIARFQSTLPQGKWQRKKEKPANT